MPFIRPKGSPKVPGSGRRRGTRNRRTVAAVALASELMSDVGYQYRFRRDFTRRRVHPSIETLIWHYVAGKPKESIQMTGNIEFSERLEAERELFAKLDVKQLEELAAESQALVNKAMAMVRANAPTPGGVTAPHAPADGGKRHRRGHRASHRHRGERRVTDAGVFPGPTCCP